jgi:hypothetical protein
MFVKELLGVAKDDDCDEKQWIVRFDHFTLLLVLWDDHHTHTYNYVTSMELETVFIEYWIIFYRISIEINI